jgi:hypothetical protein
MLGGSADAQLDDQFLLIGAWTILNNFSLHGSFASFGSCSTLSF